MTGEVCFHGLDQLLIGVAVLQPTLFRNTQQTLRETATQSTLCSKALPAIAHRRMKSPLGRAVGGFNLSLS